MHAVAWLQLTDFSQIYSGAAKRDAKICILMGKGTVRGLKIVDKVHVDKTVIILKDISTVKKKPGAM